MRDLSLEVVGRDGGIRVLKARAGDVVMPLLRNKVDLSVGICGGAISCGTCRVLVDADWFNRLPAAGADESDMLSVLGDEPEARLACQISLTDEMDGLRMTIAPA